MIIVNADDFGASTEINEAIIAGHEAGLIPSATLLITAPFADAAIELAKAHPTLDVGLHLDTSEFPPFCDAWARKRRELGDASVRTLRWIDRSTKAALEEEWRCQIAVARRRGIEPSHLDSHQFDHINPLLAGALVRTARESNIRRVRGNHNLWVDAPSRLVQTVKSSHLRFMRRGGLTTPDLMTNADTFLTVRELGGLRTWGSIELMIHPGHPGYVEETERWMRRGGEFLASGDLVSWAQFGTTR